MVPREREVANFCVQKKLGQDVEIFCCEGRERDQNGQESSCCP